MMGFNPEQFVDTVNEHLQCLLCDKVLDDPWQCKEGHLFCSDCIKPWLNTEHKCPVDKEKLEVNDLARSLVAKNMIDNLKVYCDPRKRHVAESGDKCDWTGKLQSLAKHRETCPFQPVQCPNVNCNTNIQRREQEDHDKICEYKELECDEQCGVTLIRRDMPNHKRNDCPQVTLPCPNGCGRRIKRKKITEHRGTCPFQQVQCPNVNCNTNMRRRELEDHDKICEYKVVECDEQCGLTLFRRRDLPNHKRNVCPEVTLPCPNGCETSIKRKYITKHKETCPFQQVQCPNVNCNTNMQRRELEGHDKICEYKVVKCDEQCGVTLIRRDLSGHKRNDCPEARLTCPNSCTQKVILEGPDVTSRVKRKDLDDHVKNNCTMAVVSCDFKNQGCPEQVTRQDLQNHLNDNMSSHMLMLAAQNTQLQKENRSLLEKVESLSTSLEAKTSLLDERRARFQETVELELKKKLRKVKEDLFTYTWVIHEYPTLLQKYPVGSGFKSSSFKFCGCKWYLMLYPNGDHFMLSKGFLSLHLCIADSSLVPDVLKLNRVPSQEVHVNYRLTVMSRLPGKNVSCEKTMVFNKTTVSEHHKVMTTDKAVSQDYCDYLQNNRLVVKCTIYPAM